MNFSKRLRMQSALHRLGAGSLYLMRFDEAEAEDE